MVSHHSAASYEAMTAIVDLMPNDDLQWATESAGAEIRCALHLTRRAAETELVYALNLRDRLPGVSALLSSGRIDVRRAKTIVRATEHLSVAHARDVVDRIIDAAHEMTTGQLRSRLRRLAMEAHPDDARRRYETAVADRRIVTESTIDGRPMAITCGEARSVVRTSARREVRDGRSFRVQCVESGEEAPTDRRTNRGTDSDRRCR
jgi:hypothetical protein